MTGDKDSHKSPGPFLPFVPAISEELASSPAFHQQAAKKYLFSRLIKNVQMQGTRNSKE